MRFNRIMDILIIFKGRENVSKKELNGWGYNYSDIDNLVEQKIIVSDGDDAYSLAPTYDILKYYFLLIKNRNYDEAKQFLLRLYELDSSNYQVNNQLFIRSLSEENINSEEVFKYFDVVYDHLSASDYNYGDANYYLYLLNIICDDVPKKYEDILKKIDLEDILLKPNVKNSKFKNSIREYVFNGYYYTAVDKFNNYFFSGERKKMPELIERYLLKKLKWKELVLDRKFCQCIGNGDISEGLDIIEEANKKNLLVNHNDEYCLKVCKDYIDMLLTRKVPVVKEDVSCWNVRDYLNNNDYIRALAVVANLNGIKSEKLALLLRKTCSLVDNLNLINEVDSKEKQSIGNIGLSDAVYNILINGNDAVILGEVNEDKLDDIYDIVDKIKNVSYFTFGFDKKNVVLYYNPSVDYEINFDVLREIADDLYNNGEYERALYEYRDMFMVTEPNDVVYEGYGKCLEKLGRHDDARDFLNIADGLKKKKLDWMFLKLEKNDSVESTIKQFDFVDCLVDFMKIDHGSFDEAISVLDLTEEEKNYARLIYAHDCYLLGFISDGDEYIEQVEKSPYKNRRISLLFNKLRRDKLFLKNRCDDDGMCLVLKNNNILK